MKPLEEQHTPRKEDPKRKPLQCAKRAKRPYPADVRLRIKSATPIGGVFGFSTFAVRIELPYKAPLLSRL